MRSTHNNTMFVAAITTLLCLASSIITTTTGFSTSLPFAPPSSQRRTTYPIRILWAAKPKKKQRKSDKSSGFGGGSGAGGGFGGGGGTKKSGGTTSSSDNSNNKNKVRSVSGYTGSGTKPLRIAANTFDTLRQKYGKDCSNDIYVRSPLNDKTLFWYVGKVARRMDINDNNLVGISVPTESEAILSQKRLILEYAKNQLRPQNFGGPYAKGLELWLAPGDSEMDVVQNKVSLVKVNGSTSDISDTFNVADVGFNPEIYVGDEIKDGGLRVVRDEDGNPVKPVFEINN